MHKSFIRAAALLGALAVALGAFGAHALRGKIADAAVSTFQTGVQYHFYHVLAILAAGILYKDFSNKLIVWAADLFILGIFLFSGSLYVLTGLIAAAKPGFEWVGIITPIGGLAFIAGWFCLFIGVSKSSK